MIIAEQKPVCEVSRMIEGRKKVLVVGCRSCVAICLAGGDKEVASLAEALRLMSDAKGKGWDIDEAVLDRQCEKEFVGAMAQKVEGKDAIISMACGVGAQVVQEAYPGIQVFPGLNTVSMGAPEEQGIYLEKCGGCGECVLHLTGGICPIARCSKSLLNGPCGGSQNGKCEVDQSIPCGWEMICRSLQRLGREDLIGAAIPPKDWRPSRNGGVRRTVRKDMVRSEEETGITEGKR